MDVQIQQLVLELEEVLIYFEFCQNDADAVIFKKDMIRRRMIVDKMINFEKTKSIKFTVTKTKPSKIITSEIKS
jgi:hypothetical protein